VSRAYDLILHGATGFTGRLIASYLNANAPSEIRWAISGRNLDKLKSLQSELAADANVDESEIPLIVADSLVESDMLSLALGTRVVISVVGPYSLYGELLVKACVESGTDCLDLTGENHFVRRLIDRYHDEAVARGVKIINSCGFDSIPSDMGVWMMQQHAIETFDAPLRRIDMAVSRISGALSGGTMASMTTLLENRHDPVTRRAMGHPYGLNPRDGVKGADGPDLRRSEWSVVHQSWVAPFMMAAINTRIVRRSHALSGWPWGEDFRYSEVSAYGRGFKGWRRAKTMSFGIGFFYALMLWGPTRSALTKWFLPKPGEGPDESKRAKGHFRFQFQGEGRDGRKLRARVGARMDPGYECTAMMISQCALSLILNRDSLPDSFGILTPSTAFGGVLLSRLESAGMHFELQD